MPNGMIQNELNMIMREASTQAMIESQKRKEETKEKVEKKAEILVQPTQKQEPQCKQQHLEDGSISLICSLVLSIIIK